MQNTTVSKTYHILLVEDNPADRKLIAHLFKACSVSYELHMVKDGEEATDFLFHRAAFVGSPRPNLVLLDLNMPNKDGRDVLKEIKSDPILRRIPVVVLTTSSSDFDVCSAYDYQANSYIQKPRDLAEFQSIIKLIEQYWLSAVQLPRFKLPPATSST
jgi:two-component system, chemotaxis family, response regulator Rcp1